MNHKEKQKETLRDMVDRNCQGCSKNEDEVGTLDIHRIKRGHKGGKYVPNNLKIVCRSCHKKLHGGEFN